MVGNSEVIRRRSNHRPFTAFDDSAFGVAKVAVTAKTPVWWTTRPHAVSSLREPCQVKCGGAWSTCGRPGLGRRKLFAVDLYCEVANDEGRNSEDAKHGDEEKQIE